jgi:hypothetical protein
VALRHPRLEQRFDRLEVFGYGESWKTFEMGRSLVVNRQFGVVGVRLIHPLRRLPKTLTQLSNEVGRGGRELERLAIRR